MLGDSALGEDGTLLLKAEYCPAVSVMGEQAVKTQSAQLYESHDVSIKTKMI